MSEQSTETAEAATPQDVREVLRDRRERMLEGGGADRIESQHQKGKLTARERLSGLLDEGSFIEQQPYA